MAEVREVQKDAVENTLDDLFKSGEDAMREILAGTAEEPVEEPEAVVEEIPA